MKFFLLYVFILLFIGTGCRELNNNYDSSSIKEFSRKWLKADTQQRYQLVTDIKLKLLQNKLKGKSSKSILQILGKPNTSIFEKEKLRLRYNLDDIFSFYTLEILFDKNSRVLFVDIYD